MLLGFFSPGDASIIVSLVVFLAGIIAQRNRRDIKMITVSYTHLRAHETN